MDYPTPSTEQIRAGLLARAQHFSRASGKSLSAIGREAINDDRFLHRVRNGEGFSVTTYQRVIDWLDAAESRPPEQGDAA